MAEQATHGFTRRSFIKGAAALTAAGALVGCSPQTQNLEKVLIAPFLLHRSTLHCYSVPWQTAT